MGPPAGIPCHGPLETGFLAAEADLPHPPRGKPPLGTTPQSLAAFAGRYHGGAIPTHCRQDFSHPIIAEAALKEKAGLK